MSEEIMAAGRLLREQADLRAEASALRQLATQLVMELRGARTDAYGPEHAETADVFDVAASVLDNRRAGQPLLEEVARLRAQRNDANTALALTSMELHEAQADATAIRDAFKELIDQVRHWHAGRIARHDLLLAEGVARRALAIEHPGRALLAELTAARAVVAATRNPLNPPHVERLFAAYDEATKART